jgi:hypothetical protein
MAALYARKFGTLEAVNTFLRGGIKGGAELSPTVFGLHGKTLVFNAPSGTVTFADATGAGLTLDAIATQIKAAIATLAVRFDSRHVVLEYATPGTAVNLDNTGTANAAFGFDTAADTVGKVFAPYTGSAPRLLSLQPWGQMDGVVTVTEE